MEGWPSGQQQEGHGLTWFQEEGRNLKLSHWGGLEKVKLLTVLREMLTGQVLGVLEGCSQAGGREGVLRK